MEGREPGGVGEREMQDWIMLDVLRSEDFIPHMIRRVFGGL